jgi:hypothetical protein
VKEKGHWIGKEREGGLSASPNKNSAHGLLARYRLYIEVTVLVTTTIDYYYQTLEVNWL